MSVSFLGSQKAESGVIATSLPPSMISSGTAHTKGIWYQSIAATANPTAWLLVQVSRPNQAVDYLIDVGIGAAGVETVLIGNIPASQNDTNSRTASNFLLPLHIPAGSRLATRIQASTGTSICNVQLTVFAPMFGGEKGLEQVETCGAQTGTSLGKTIPGHTTTANTKGTWTELIAATSFAYKWVCLGITHTNAIGVASTWTIDIGVGAGSAEVVVVPDICVAGGSVQDAVSNGGRSFPLSIPAGSRVSARCQCSNATASERDLEVVLLGVG